MVKHYRYLIIGGGMTAAAAVTGIRENDAEGSIGVISAEMHAPYDRPPLSKRIWKGKLSLDKVMRPLSQGVELHLGRRVEKLDLERKQAIDDQGVTWGWDKLLLATGASPRRLPFGGDTIIYYRTLDDYHRLRSLADSESDFVVIGGGFIGSEIAAALAMQGKQVSILFPDPGLCYRVFPAEISEFVTGYYRRKGVQVLPGEKARDVVGSGRDLTVLTGSERSIQANAVIAGIGVRPNTELAVDAGLDVDNGIVVDNLLRTSHADVFAAGDVANFPDCLLGVRRRVEHEDNANQTGMAAGRIMAGGNAPYDNSPFFYSDLFDLGYEAVGELDSRLETVIDWQEPFRKGVVYYLRDRRVCGVLLWDMWGKVPEARTLIARGETVTPESLAGRIA